MTWRGRLCAAARGGADSHVRRVRNCDHAGGGLTAQDGTCPGGQDRRPRRAYFAVGDFARVRAQREFLFLSFFNLIVPCGITSKPVTSMKKELGREVDMEAVAHSLSRNFGTVFGRQMLRVESLDALLWACWRAVESASRTTPSAREDDAHWA